MQQWLGSPGRDLAVGDWSLTEAASALSMKVRVGAMSLHERTAATSAIAVLVARTHLTSVKRAHFSEAAKLIEQPELGLRAGDALHLAICQDLRLTLVTLDERLAEAASAVRVAVVEP